MNTKQFTVALFLLMFAASFAEATAQDQASSSKPSENKNIAQSQPQHVARSQPQHQDVGSRIFNQNCSRCHNTPEGFSPRISGTVVKHMRVRASLSAEDEKQLLRFLNP